MSNPFTTLWLSSLNTLDASANIKTVGKKTTTTTGFVPPRLHFTTQTTEKQPNINDRVNRYITDLPAIKHFPVVSDLIVLGGGLEGCNYRIKTMISKLLLYALETYFYLLLLYLI